MRLALFDLDGTLLPLDSDHAFNEFVIGLGWVDARSYRERNDAFYADYQSGKLDIHAYIDFATTPWRTRPLHEAQGAREAFVGDVIRPALHPAATALVESHRRRGDVLAIVTATNEFVTRPIADLFGVPELLATELEWDAQGRATGAIRGIPAFREGKVARVRAWLEGQGRRLEDFEASTFYSDSTNDQALLEAVTHPVATNPSPALASHARQQGWGMLSLFDA